MPRCANCQEKWCWKYTMKMLMTFQTEMVCPFCHERQYQSGKFQGMASLSSLIILSPAILTMFIDIPVIVSVALIPILAIAILLFFPFFVKLSSTKEYF